MELEAQIKKFIEHPFPIWETNLTSLLVRYKCEELKREGISSNEYSTAGAWFKTPILDKRKQESIAEKHANVVYIETSSSLLKPFYDEHGLELLTERELETCGAVKKLESAIEVLREVPAAYDCVVMLVRRIQVLKQPDAEVDVSYSHPEIPYSIFVSVCEDDSMISNHRVAESILHEAMHLKLTLIENIVPLVNPYADSLFYSPWRDEERPIRGVLHGLFVFRTVLDFYNQLIKRNQLHDNYLLLRIMQIEKEIMQLKDFPLSSALNEYGASLSANLLPLN